MTTGIKAVLEGDFSTDAVIHPGDGIPIRIVPMVTDWEAVPRLETEADDTLQRFK